ncbi:MAG: 4-alpha-glucanotransferase [Rhodospirillales bacterium]|nr:4-alpha-glucanotransferase [Rhodospirillales bacterium]
MTDTSALDRLAEQAGIEPRYWDIWGNQHEASEATKRTLLAAMGIPAANDSQVWNSIRHIEEEPWHHPLPPVLVVRERKPATIPLSLPADNGHGRLAIEITEETGAFHRFEIMPSDLHLVESRIVDRRPMQRRMYTLPKALPTGYHECRLVGIAGRSMRLIVTPERCYLPASLEKGGKRWGFATHVYTLRSSRDWGMGDFGSLTDLVDVSAKLGAASIGVNPLHALFPEIPERASPYSPSSRLFLNPLYLDVESVSGFEPGTGTDVKTASVESGKKSKESKGILVDYTAVTKKKFAALKNAHDCFKRKLRASDDHSEADEAYSSFRKESGERLRRFAIFEALSEHFEGKPWQDWPTPYRDPHSPEVAAFARKHQDRVSFHKYLQWETERQLAEVQDRTKAAGLEIGLYRDLAVGVDPSGADAWSEQGVIVNEASVGCPPDPFNMLGQDWGTPPLSPRALAERAYEPFIAMLRANMRNAGALRIDHAMGLMHLFWIPIGETPAAGAYVQYPFEDLLGILALESHRNACLVIGEDLGTVPDGFRERMAAANVLSYRVLYFEKEDDRFKQPDAYPTLALACVTTHDLSTLEGFWKGSDIDLKHRLKLYPSKEAENNERESRRDDRRMMLDALAGEGLLPSPESSRKPDDIPLTPELVAAIHAYLSRSPAALMMVQIDDVTGETEQINLPGTVDEYPNWRRRLRTPTNEITQTRVMRSLVHALKERRGETP